MASAIKMRSKINILVPDFKSHGFFGAKGLKVKIFLIQYIDLLYAKNAIILLYL